MNTLSIGREHEVAVRFLVTGGHAVAAVHSLRELDRLTVARAAHDVWVDAGTPVFVTGPDPKRPGRRSSRKRFEEVTRIATVTPKQVRHGVLPDGVVIVVTDAHQLSRYDLVALIGPAVTERGGKAVLLADLPDEELTDDPIGDLAGSATVTILG